MLRPAWWLAERKVVVGGKVDIEVPECGISGLADVLDIQPCPAIDSGPGRTVKVDPNRNYSEAKLSGAPEFSANSPLCNRVA